MKEISSDKLITAIDVGTTKICVLVAHQTEHGTIDILGIGKAPSYGLKKGIVVDVAKTVQAIKLAIKEAERMAGITIQSVGIGISGAHIRAANSLGVTPVKFGAITSYDVHQALAAAKAIPIPEGLQILQVLPQYFVIDGQERILNPVGMHGVRLEVHAHLIMGSVTNVQNLVTCCQLAGVTVADIVLEQLASAQAVLSADEKELGVAMLDIGGGTSDFAVYRNDSIWHTKVIPLAGNHFTQDIAIGVRTTLEEAERLKKTYGLLPAPNTNDVIEIETVQRTKQPLALKNLHLIISSRAQELMTLVHEEIKAHNLHETMPTGMVLTGGGSLLKGLPELGEKICGIPVRVGVPQIAEAYADTLGTPQYATSYGLLFYLAQQKAHAITAFDGPLIHRVFKRMRTWVSEIF